MLFFSQTSFAYITEISLLHVHYGSTNCISLLCLYYMVKTFFYSYYSDNEKRIYKHISERVRSHTAYAHTQLCEHERMQKHVDLHNCIIAG